MTSWEDYDNDYEVGFVISHADDLEEVGWRGVVKKIRETVGDNPVYSELTWKSSLAAWSDDPLVTLDIDVIDPGMAPAYVVTSVVG